MTGTAKSSLGTNLFSFTFTILDKDEGLLLASSLSESVRLRRELLLEELDDFSTVLMIRDPEK